MTHKSDLYNLWIPRILKKKFQDAQPADIISLEVEPAMPKGVNYVSEVNRVTMKILTQGGHMKSKSMIIKHSKQAIDNVFQQSEIFKLETKAFSILGQMGELMDEFEDKREKPWPDFYDYKPFYLIAMEDLKAHDFILVDRTSWLDIDHSLLVLRSLGRFHALSKILLSRGVIDNNDKGQHWTSPNAPMSQMGEKLFSGGIHMLSRAIQNKSGSWSSDTVELGERIQKQISSLPSTVWKIYSDYDKKFEVLNHGDLWTSNMMFKEMEYTGLPTAVKFLDYQMTHINSFIWDITYFMRTSVKPSVRRANHDLLFKAYHQSLSDNLKFFQFSGYIPTLEDVMSENKRVLPLAFGITCSSMPITTATTTNAFSLEKLMTHLPEEVFCESIFNEEKFVREVTQDLKDFARLNVI